MGERKVGVGNLEGRGSGATHDIRVAKSQRLQRLQCNERRCEVQKQGIATKVAKGKTKEIGIRRKKGLIEDARIRTAIRQGRCFLTTFFVSFLFC